MAKIKLTQNELRAQEKKLAQLERYLPTLQLKKAMLQSEIYEARIEIAKQKTRLKEAEGAVEGYSSLFSQKIHLNLQDAVKIQSIEKHYDNIAGVEIPSFDSLKFKDFSYPLFDTPVWVDQAILGLRNIAEFKVLVEIAEEKKTALEEELRRVSIRVNLFEKILIPRAKKQIKKIKVFLGDQELAAVSRAKSAKVKIEEKKRKKKVIWNAF